MNSRTISVNPDARGFRAEYELRRKNAGAIHEQVKIFEVPCDIPELRLITLHRIGKIKKAVYVRTPQAGAEGIFA